MELTKEQICIKIDELSRELTSYQAMLDDIKVQEESEFSRKVKSMAGCYYMKDLGNSKWYCRINRVDNVKDSNIDGLYARCECTYILIPEDPKYGYRAYVDYIYVNEYDIVDYKSITEGEFDAVLAQFIKKFKGQ